MKTVGQLLHSERIKKNISISDLSLATKIDIKYIEAIEADNYDRLPSETFTKGFIRNIALNLDCDPKDFIAVFRRDYKTPNQQKSFFKQHKKTRLQLAHLSPQILPIFIGVSVFLIYLLFQFRVILRNPPLEVNKPQTGTVLSSPLELTGKTSADSLVTVNNNSVVKPDQNGVFQIYINLPVGETVISVKTTNRFSRTSTIEIPVTVISN